MVYYLYADFPYSVKLDGNFFLSVYNGAQKLDIIKDTLIEILPLSDVGEYFGFTLNGSCPKNNFHYISIDLSGGYFIKLKNVVKNKPFKVILQEKSNNSLCTLFTDNAYKLSIDSPFGMLTDTFDFELVEPEIHFNKDLIILSAINFCAIYIEQPAIKKVFSSEGEIDAEKLILTQDFKDIAKHSVRSFLKSDKGEIVVYKKEFSYKKDVTKLPLTDKVIPYAFLEELLHGENYKFFLSDGILPDADKITKYLGNFIGIITPPDFRNFDEIGLIYKTDRYFVKYYTFSMTGNKIDNIKKTAD